MRYIGIHIIAIRQILTASRMSLNYLDPGTGSMLLQVILGGVAGAAVAVKMFWHRIIAFIPSRGKGPGESSADQ